MSESQPLLPSEPQSPPPAAGPSSPLPAPRSAAADAALLRSSAPPSDTAAKARLAQSAEKRALLKIIDDDILGRNPRPVALDTLDLLITLTTNALSSTEKRSIRLSNAQIKRRIVDVQGAVNFLLKSYWSKQVIEYQEHLVFPEKPSEKQLEQLKLANQTVKDRTGVVKEVSEKAERNRKANQAAEKARTAQTLMAIRDDRLSTEARAERERLAREVKKEMAQREAEKEEADRLAELEAPSTEGKKDR